MQMIEGFLRTFYQKLISMQKRVRTRIDTKNYKTREIISDV